MERELDRGRRKRPGRRLFLGFAVGDSVRRKRIGFGGVFGVAVSEEDGALAVREEGGGVRRSGDADDVGVGAQGAVVELGEVADAELEACADGERPEDAMLAELEFAGERFGGEALDIGFGGAGEEKKFVEIALAGEFGFAEGESGVLDELTGRERAQRHDRDPGVVGEGFQGIRGGWEGFRSGNAGEAAETNCSWRALGANRGSRVANCGRLAVGSGSGRFRTFGCWRTLVAGSEGLGTQVEIAFGQVDAATVFGDEGMLVAEATARLVELEARAAGEPDRGDAGMIEGSGELVEARNAPAARGDERINGDVKNAGSLAQTRLRKVRSILAEIRAGKSLGDGARFEASGRSGQKPFAGMKRVPWS
jgi:hypothetical protein